MTVAIALILVAGALLVVFYPIVRSRRKGGPVSPGDPFHLQPLLGQREALVGTLMELELDRGLGNVEEADYRELREEYEHQAMAVLKAIDMRTKALDQSIEEEVMALRDRRSQPSSEGAEGPA